MKALSIRGPWWWFILCGHPWAKDVECRDWPPPKEQLGRYFQIHAAKAMTKKEFDEACKFALKAGATMLPRFDELERGGIVGIVRLVRWSRSDDSKWFTGKFGWVIERAYPLPFRPCVGQLGFFDPVTL